MPGIAGIISRDKPDDCRRQLAAMVQSLQHDPTCASATCEAADLGVYAAVVARPDSFAALESGQDATGMIDLVFAGECFHQDTTTSLLQRYDASSENWLADLNGLFSGLLIDRRRGIAHLFNDRYGVERVYVHETERAICFASEAKALLSVMPRAFDEEGVAQFLAFGCPVDGKTLFEGIRILDGGSIWTFEGRSCRKGRYFTPATWESQSPLSVEDFQEAFQSTFRTALPRYIRGNDRIGISLTGGLDTRMIMACLPRLDQTPICYTFAGLQGETRDAQVAARVAAECGLPHQLLRIDRTFLSDYSRYVDHTVYVTDGYAGALGAHEIHLNAQARRLSPFRLTGNFGSEVLRGMSTFKALHLWPDLIAPDFRARVETAARQSPNGDHTSVTFAAFREVPRNLFGTMTAAKTQVTFRTPYLDNDLVALAYRAPDTLRHSPAPALRLVRNTQPRLADIATDRALRDDGRGLRYWLRRLGAEFTFKLEYIHKEAPPGWLMRSPRALAAMAGISRLSPHKYLPYSLWFRNELATYVAEVLSDAANIRVPFWNEQSLIAIARDHASGRRNYVREINAALTLNAVDRLLLRGPTA